MIAPVIDSERAIAKFFNSAVIAAAIVAAWEAAVHVHSFAAKKDLDIDLDVVGRNRDAGTVTAGQLLDETYEIMSLFHWLALGYALRNKNRTGDYYSRDPVAIADACAKAYTQFFDPVFLPAVNALGYKYHAVADRGYGSGEQFMQLMERHASTTGIGIDIARPAIKDAAAEAARRGLGGRLAFIEGDVRTIAPQPGSAHVDLLTCFLLGHDFWPPGNCVAILRKLREAFLAARRFFLGDTTRVLLNTAARESKYAITTEDAPIFTLGFEVAHAMMGDYVPTMDEWRDLKSDFKG
ncbi:methyltransferase MppJ [Xylariaceae sp. FL0804]|nr:methyltransferase MppJ [Xylariaceae sp. FL0804]